MPQDPQNPSLDLAAQPLPVVTDFGPVGKGASRARYVLAENAEEYLAKGPSLVGASLRYVAANELIAVELAERLGLPVLDHRLLAMHGNLFFGSRWMQGSTFYPAITADLLARCENRDRVYDLVVFDAWVCNSDRHHENLLVRKVRRHGETDRLLLVLNDHSHCLASPTVDPKDLMANQLTSPPSDWVRLDFITSAIDDDDKLAAAIARAEAFPSAAIRSILHEIPDEFLREPTKDRRLLEEFLINRKEQLRTLFEGDRFAFPNLARTTV